jgi:hypothetical protein
MTSPTPEFVEIFASNADQPAIARRLLAAAGGDPDGSLVRTVSQGFRVPVAVAEAAGFTTADSGAVDAAAVEGDALAQTALDGPRADVLAGHAPETLPAKVDGGPDNLTDQRLDGPADAADRPAEVQVAAETGAVVAPDPRTAGGEDPEELRGDALDDALRAAGLSTSGKADEKRARLAEHRAGSGQ